MFEEHCVSQSLAVDLSEVVSLQKPGDLNHVETLRHFSESTSADGISAFASYASAEDDVP